MRVEWPFVFTGPGRLISETYPPELDPVHFAASEGDALISYAAILRLTLAHAGANYAAYGFGNMFTFPPYRREGHGQRVLECATAYIRNSDVDIAILFCDAHLETFYARCGWEAIRSPTYVGPAEAQHEHPASKMMLFLSEKGQAQRVPSRPSRSVWTMRGRCAVYYIWRRTPPPPTTHERKDSLAMNTATHPGRPYVIGVIVACLLVSLSSILLTSLAGGPQNLGQQGIRLLLTIGLCFYLYQGRNWARWWPASSLAWLG